MKTRTLLLLSIVTGLAILVAGGIQLIRVSSQSSSVESYGVGEAARVGDMDVTVEGATVDGDRLVVRVVLGGVEEPDGADGFSLVAPGAGAIEPMGADATAGTMQASTCAATGLAPAPCELVFDVAAAEGEARTLRYERGEDRARWQLTPD